MKLSEVYKTVLVEETARRKLNQIVRNLLKKYVGGRPFFNDKSFVYVDDSMFSGGTVRKIDDYLKEYHNSKLKSVSVVYDGSKEKNKLVKSLFRYYP